VPKVKLLVQLLSFVDQEDCFALRGGTAINLFVCEFPRLSVDIDLTYLPTKTGDEALIDIRRALDHPGDCRHRGTRLEPASPGAAYVGFGRRIDAKRCIGNEIYFLRNSHYYERQATGPARRYSLEP
jgi:hypothetical protein